MRRYCVDESLQLLDQVEGMMNITEGHREGRERGAFGTTGHERETERRRAEKKRKRDRKRERQRGSQLYSGLHEMRGIYITQQTPPRHKSAVELPQFKSSALQQPWSKWIVPFPTRPTGANWWSSGRMIQPIRSFFRRLHTVSVRRVYLYILFAVI